MGSILKGLLGSLSGGSWYLVGVVALAGAISAASLSWTVKGWKDGVELASSRAELTDYKLSVVEDANSASQSALNSVQNSLRLYTKLQSEALQTAQSRDATSKLLLERLNNATANDPVCPATADYLNGLRELQTNRNP